jgi:hypothetical protein
MKRLIFSFLIAALSSFAALAQTGTIAGAELNRADSRTACRRSPG